MGILVVGTVAFDSVKTPEGEASDAIGGSATYFSAAASFYAPVDVIAVVGNDFPMASLDFLRERQVDVSGLEVKEGKTFRWAGEYAANMNDRRTIDTQLNVFSGFKPVLADRHRAHDHVFLANLDPDVQRDVLTQACRTDQSDRPGVVACDTMDFWIEGQRTSLLSTLSGVDVLIINDSEALQLVEDHNLVRAAERILELGPRAVVVKRGAHGATLCTRDAWFGIPSFPVADVVDPTGAGDTFAGGFMGYLARSGEMGVGALKRAMVHGSVMASFNVEDFSVRRLESLTQDEITDRHDRFMEMITP
ncbi:MAG: sugar kinase [Gemmatimonadetes bacterium]|nr:sugar kinase [Gemmatimonadota bacterium]MYG16065.1 sugar kinase [Gemmatimonadota bacterium]